MLYSLARYLLVIMVRLIAKMEITGLENLPASGSFILAGNHIGRLDPFLFYSVSNRRDIILLVAEKYQKYAILRWLVKQVNGIFVDRYSADFHALRIVLNRLQKGGVLVIAPEGTRSASGNLLEGRAGTTYLAAKSGLPIVPVAATGTEDAVVMDRLKHFRRLHIRAYVGEPFTLPPLSNKNRGEQIQQGTDEIMCRIAALLPPDRRGVYANHPRLMELLDAERDKDTVEMF